MTELQEKHFLFVGLGNPGKKYEMTRHNMGYLVIQVLAHEQGMPLKEEKRFQAKVGKSKIQDVIVHLILPTTYMNESGQAVRKYMDYFKLTPQNLVVVSDDADLPFEEIRLRSQGSAGGHNGLKSIERHLGTQKYARMKMGIGRKNEQTSELSNFVLDNFNKKELNELPALLDKGAQTLKLLLTESVENVMNTVNIRKKKELQDTSQEQNKRSIGNGKE